MIQLVKQIKQTQLENLEKTHIKILEERFLFAAKRREQLLKDNPSLTDEELWAVDLDLNNKKRDLDMAIEASRKRRKL